MTISLLDSTFFEVFSFLNEIDEEYPPGPPQKGFFSSSYFSLSFSVSMMLVQSQFSSYFFLV
jgi:hypothetical protein